MSPGHLISDRIFDHFWDRFGSPLGGPKSKKKIQNLDMDSFEPPWGLKKGTQKLMAGRSVGHIALGPPPRSPWARFWSDFGVTFLDFGTLGEGLGSKKGLTFHDFWAPKSFSSSLSCLTLPTRFFFANTSHKLKLHYCFSDHHGTRQPVQADFCISVL